MSSHVVIPVLAAFAVSLVLGPIDDSFFAETENEADGACRRRAVSFEKSGNSDDGRRDHSCGCYCDTPCSM